MADEHERSGSSSTADALAESPASPGARAVGRALRLVGAASYEERASSHVPGPSHVAYFTLRLSDGDGEWEVTRRYSKWRQLLGHVAERWGRTLLEPSALPFPPKAMPAMLSRPQPSQLEARAEGIEAFVRGLIERAQEGAARGGEDDSGLLLWLHHWLRGNADRSSRAGEDEAPPEAAPALD